MKEETQKKLFEIMDSVFDLPDGTVNATATHEQIEAWDSINVVNLIVAIEGEFLVSLDVEDAQKMVSVEAVASILEEKGVQ